MYTMFHIGTSKGCFGRAGWQLIASCPAAVRKIGLGRADASKSDCGANDTPDTVEYSAREYVICGSWVNDKRERYSVAQIIEERERGSQLSNQEHRSKDSFFLSFLYFSVSECCMRLSR